MFESMLCISSLPLHTNIDHCSYVYFMYSVLFKFKQKNLPLHLFRTFTNPWHNPTNTAKENNEGMQHGIHASKFKAGLTPGNGADKEQNSSTSEEQTASKRRRSTAEFAKWNKGQIRRIGGLQLSMEEILDVLQDIACVDMRYISERPHKARCEKEREGQNRKEIFDAKSNHEIHNIFVIKEKSNIHSQNL